VQLDEIGGDGGDDLAERGIIRIDDESDAARTAGGSAGEGSGSRKVDVAGALRIENETDVVRARVQRRIERRLRLQTANLDLDRHRMCQDASRPHHAGRAL